MFHYVETRSKILYENKGGEYMREEALQETKARLQQLELEDKFLESTHIEDTLNNILYELKSLNSKQETVKTILTVWSIITVMGFIGAIVLSIAIIHK